MSIHIQLIDGTRGDLLNPNPEWFDIRKVAHSLSQKNRWCGQAHTAMTVAEHCTRMSRLFAATHIATCALLHELDEVLLPDIPGPLKVAPEMAWYREICARHMAAGSAWFGILWPWSREVTACIKAADRIMLETEARDLTANAEWRRKPGVEPLAERIIPLSPELARQEFVARFEYLSGLRRTASLEASR